MVVSPSKVVQSKVENLNGCGSLMEWLIGCAYGERWNGVLGALKRSWVNSRGMWLEEPKGDALNLTLEASKWLNILTTFHY